MSSTSEVFAGVCKYIFAQSLIVFNILDARMMRALLTHKLACIVVSLTMQYDATRAD